MKRFARSPGSAGQAEQIAETPGIEARAGGGDLRTAARRRAGRRSAHDRSAFALRPEGERMTAEVVQWERARDALGGTACGPRGSY